MFLLSLFAVFNSITSNEISCEKEGLHDWDFNVAKVKTCFMDKTTLINQTNVTIANVDDSFKGLSFEGNKNIRFLPVQVAEKIPNLLTYNARKCSVEDVSKENFKGLNKLKILHLAHNQIVVVPIDVFSDLSDLKALFLSENFKVSV